MTYFRCFSVSASPVRGERYRLKRGTKLELELTFKYVKKKATDTVYDALLAAFLDESPVGLEYYDDEILSAVKKVTGWFTITEFSHPAKSEEGVIIDVKCEPTDYAEGGVLIPPVMEDA